MSLRTRARAVACVSALLFFFLPRALFSQSLFTAPSYGSGGSAVSVAVADFNGDGRPDVAVVNANGSVGVLLGNGDGTYQTATTYAVGGYTPKFLVVGDFNGDGKPDLAVVSYCLSLFDCSNGLVTILLGNGDGTFQGGGTYSSGGADGVSVAVGDFNGDGKLDVVVANACANSNNCSNGSVGVLLGNGDGTFQSAVSYPSGGFDAMAVVVGDFNGDGQPDLAVANSCTSNADCSNGAVGVLVGNGDGTFRFASSYASAGYQLVSAAVGDFNGDGHPDLAVISQCTSSNDCTNGILSVLVGNGDGTFQAAISYASVATNPVLSRLATLMRTANPIY